MTLPTLITVKALIRDSAGPVAGRLVFARDTQLFPASSADDSYPIPEVIEVVVGADGVVEQAIYSTDDPACSPSGWTWEVRTHFPHWRASFSISVPYNAAGGEINLNQLAPVPPDGDGDLYSLANHTHADGGGAGDPVGTAAALVAAHEAAVNPHPQYLTQAEGDAAYQPIGGGGSSGVTTARGYIGSGDVVPQQTASFAIVTGTPTFSVAAAAGDEIVVLWSGLLQFRSSQFYDLCVIKGGLPVRYASSGTSTPAVEGDPGLYPDSAFRPKSGVFAFVAQAADISSGTVTIGFATLNPDGAGGKIYAGTAYPLRWHLTNNGPQ